ncbi:MAG: acyl-CoA dehydrogenase family protein [Betaproteobacteria bacterium]|nr:acyl-CoA dehydrogenase family protein [Betaproteobacteria bacterium]
MLLSDHGLTEEQRMMREACRAFVDDHVTPFIRQNWQREWVMTPEDRLPRKILEVADQIGIRTLGVPEEFGGTPVDAKTQIQTKHQAVAVRLADMAAKLYAVRGLLREASRAVDAGAPGADHLCSIAKLVASEDILKVCQHAVELHGGNGTMLDFGIEKLYRDATMFLHMDGTVDITRFKIVKSMFPETAGTYAGPEQA